jgi:hypothetical protein
LWKSLVDEGVWHGVQSVIGALKYGIAGKVIECAKVVL